MSTIHRKDKFSLGTLSHMSSSVPETKRTAMFSGSLRRSSLRCWWAWVCPGGCSGKDKQTTPCTAPSDSSLSCLAKAAAAQQPIDLPRDKHFSLGICGTWIYGIKPPLTYSILLLTSKEHVLYGPVRQWFQVVLVEKQIEEDITNLSMPCDFWAKIHEHTHTAR